MLFLFPLMMLYTLATGHLAASSTGDIQAGKATYTRLCVGCHRPTGQGGRMATTLAVPPRNLAEQAYMATRSYQQLCDIISQGSSTTGLPPIMMAFGNQLNEQQIWDIVAYVRTLAAGPSTPTQ